jgi:hypothetical protein
MTAVGTLCLQLFEPEKSKAVKTGVRYLEQANYFWFSWKGKDKKGHGEGSFKGLDQPVYSTALSCLMLEVYYRHMTTSAARNLEMISNKAMIEDDDKLGLKLKDKIL